MATDPLRPLAEVIAGLAAEVHAMQLRVDAQARTASLQAVRIERLEDELGRLLPGDALPRTRSWSRPDGRHSASSVRPA